MRALPTDIESISIIMRGQINFGKATFHQKIQPALQPARGRIRPSWKSDKFTSKDAICGFWGAKFQLMAK